MDYAAALSWAADMKVQADSVAYVVGGGFDYNVDPLGVKFASRWGIGPNEVLGSTLDELAEWVIVNTPPEPTEEEA